MRPLAEGHERGGSMREATELARRIRAKELSTVEVMEGHLAQIARINSQVNAVVTLLPEEAIEEACVADEALARDLTVGPLHGIPIDRRVW
jgi:Asp-tRNA(Asn)/Glu-tRNA(Gln) amidotransferase A subunit family amidase